MASVWVESRISVDGGATVGLSRFLDDRRIAPIEITSVDDVILDNSSVSNTSSVNWNRSILFGAIVSDKAVSVGWYGSSEANSSSVVLVPDVPFIFPTDTTTDYDAVMPVTSRVVDTEESITGIAVYNGSGSAAVVTALLLVDL